MRFGLFGGAKASRGGPRGDSHGYHDFIEYVLTAERLGFESAFLVEHHFTGHGQVSASMTLLAYLAARTERLRLGTAIRSARSSSRSRGWRRSATSARGSGGPTIR